MCSNEGKSAAVNVLTSGAATKGNEGAEMAEIGDMIEAGAVAISDDAFPVQSADLMRRVMEYCADVRRAGAHALRGQVADRGRGDERGHHLHDTRPAGPGRGRLKRS